MYETQSINMMNKSIPFSLVLETRRFNLSATRLEACHAIWNKGSEKVLKRNGMRFVKYIEKGYLKKGKWIDENLVVIDKEDWMNERRG